MLERDDEFALLRGLLAECRKGLGSATTITGAVASGKTELLHAFSAEVAGGGVPVLSALASSAERTLPLGVVGQLFNHASLPKSRRDHMARLFTAMQRGSGPPDQWTVNERARVMNVLWSELLLLAERGPMLITVDDVHYADAFSMRCLLYFIHRLRDAPVLMLLTKRERPQRVHPLIDADLLRLRHCHLVKLGPLGVPSVAALAAGHVPADEIDRFAGDCHEVSGGNPLLIHALLDDRRAAPAGAAGHLVVGQAYRHAVLATVHRGGRTELRVARGLAVLGDLRAPGLLEELLRVDTMAVEQAVAGLVAAGVLAHGGFRHPAGRSAVLGDMDLSHRAELRSRLARLRRGRGGKARAGSPAAGHGRGRHTAPRNAGPGATDPGAEPGGAELSGAERRVAALAAEGLMNREIAERLAITVSTVEQHLTKIYRKLEIDGRAGLAKAFAAHSDLVPGGDRPEPVVGSGPVWPPAGWAQTGLASSHTGG
ncbi:helix-turn-helix transcriptional regulator [Sinosporangium siamense]|nr:LuxR family transcriptional regulator [Sinosporangium siamense]